MAIRQVGCMKIPGMAEKIHAKLSTVENICAIINADTWCSVLNGSLIDCKKITAILGRGRLFYFLVINVINLMNIIIKMIFGKKRAFVGVGLAPMPLT